MPQISHSNYNQKGLIVIKNFHKTPAASSLAVDYCSLMVSDTFQHKNSWAWVGEQAGY
jgi:hypothetical protein